LESHAQELGGMGRRQLRSVSIECLGESACTSVLVGETTIGIAECIAESFSLAHSLLSLDFLQMNRKCSLLSHQRGPC